MRYLSIFLVASLLALAAIGCKWSFGSGADASNNSNAGNTNRSSYSSNRDDDDYASSSPTPDTLAKDLTPLDLDVDDMTSTADSEKVGRLATVTGGVLEEIRSDSLLIRGQYGGAAFYCYGDFSDYMSMADRVKSLGYSGKSPKATVKGVYKVASIGSGAELNPCVLSNIEKP